MTVYPTPSGKPTFIRRMGPWFLIIPSAIIGIILVELLGRLLAPSLGNPVAQGFGNNRIFFFAGRDPIFRTIQNIFTFTPDNEIRHVTAFFSDNGFSIEYDYHFRTNNFGLVQDADVVPGRDALLLLGDSFTEGVGAEPWFRLVSPEIVKLGYQPVNGGLLATGFEQWLKLERYLTAENLPIRKLVVVFISDDYRRPVWDFPPTPFYRLPPPEELASSIARIRTERAGLTRESWLEERAAALLPASYHLYEYVSRRLLNPGFFMRFDRAEEQSRAAIAELIRIYGPDNVVFVHIPQKNETHGPDNLGAKARRSIEEAGGRLVDGFKLCRLTASDYYPNDDHPNSGGYGKIAACVADAIKEMVTGPS